MSSRGGPQLLNTGDLPRLAKLLFTLGLRRAPPLSEILRIAASDNPTVRGKALTFFLDNLSLKYPNYDPHDYRDLAFVPAVRGSEKLLSKPFEVRDFTHHSPLYLNDAQQLYAAPEWAALGFPVVDPVLHDGTASKLKLQSHPPTSELVTLLERSPPGDEATARQWFEVLSGRGGLFRLFYLKLLHSLARRVLTSPTTEAVRDAFRTRQVCRKQGGDPTIATYSVLLFWNRRRGTSFEALLLRGFWHACQYIPSNLWYEARAIRGGDRTDLTSKSTAIL